MKLKEWIELHESKDCGVRLYNGDLIVCGIKDNSIKRDDEVFTTVVSTDRAKQLFGDFSLKMIGVAERPSGNGHTLRALIGIPDME